MTTLTWSIVTLLVVVVGWLIVLYNRLVTLRNQVDEAWSDIEVQLKRRYELIPNLVSAVKGYARHERSVFTEVTQLRNAALKAQSVKEKAQAENLITGALKSLFALAENYPKLEASANFKQLQEELADTENKVAASRRFYNGVTRDYNTAIGQFPTNLLAPSFTFKPRELFDLDVPEASVAPKVNL